jgi:FkbM family methyltransferase
MCIRPPQYEEQILAAVVQAGDICFDVGANRGDVALHLAKQVARTGLVVAFEPVWPVFQELCCHVQSDIFVKAPIITVHAGLADRESDSPINVPGGDFAMGSMAPSELWRKAHAGADMASYSARFMTLDFFLSSTGTQPPDFLKIDVEGAELLVLKGAENTFSSGIRPLMFIEVFAPWQKAFGYHPWELFSRLQDCGYSFLFACPHGLVEHVPSRERPFPAEFSGGYNVVAHVPARHSARVARLSPLRAKGKGPVHKMAPPPYPNQP